jgi:LPXTG-site transpeptidase (sortase) family protein
MFKPTQKITLEKKDKLTLRQKLGKLKHIQRPKLTRESFSKRKIFTAIFALLFLVSAAGLLYPLLPEISYRLNPPKADKIVYALSHSSDFVPIPEAKFPDTNRLVIPKIGVDSEILEGETILVLNHQEGVWHEPKAINPTEDGNMVLAGHRLQYMPPNTTTFYNLDKIAEGDKIVIYWQQKDYIYEVKSKYEVTPDQVEIKDSHKDIPHELTLYTCTPLYTSERRLVVKATLLS